MSYPLLHDFPKKLPEKLRRIRERTGLSPDEFAPCVKAESGADITSYENAGEMPITILYAYVKLSGLTIDHFMDDARDLGFWTFAPQAFFSRIYAWRDDPRPHRQVDQPTYQTVSSVDQ